MFKAQSSVFAFKLFYPLFLTGLPEHKMISKANFTLLISAIPKSAADSEEGSKRRKKEGCEQTAQRKYVYLL